MTGEDLKKGDEAAWNWGGSSIKGEVTAKKVCADWLLTFVVAADATSAPDAQHLFLKIVSSQDDKMTIESKGKPITKDGEPGNPAVKVERSKGNPVVKKASQGTSACQSLPSYGLLKS